MPGANVTVAYPQGAKFNMDYYLSTHMPLVAKTWGPHGLKSWKVLQLGNDAPYCVQATLEFGSLGEVQKAGASPEAKEMMDDIPNFTDSQPTVFAGDVVGTS